MAMTVNFGRPKHFFFQEERDDAMTKIMTPSAESKTMTNGQIIKAVANYRALLEKHGSEFDSEVVQLVLGQPELADEQFGVFRRRVEANSNMIVRRGVKVNPARTPQETLDATGRRQYADRKVVDAMPRGEGDEVDVYFFKVSRYISDDDLEKEYELRGIVPDPYAQAQVNIDDPAFADEHPNGTHWKDSNGKWCYVAFGRWYGERRVLVDRRGHDWNGYWWFGGVRKYQKKPLVS